LQWVLHSLVLCLFISAPLVWQGCADDVKWQEDTGNSEPQAPGPLNDCPPDYIRDDGSCWIEDPADRAAFNGQTEEVNQEDLLNVDNEILQQQETNYLSQESIGKYYVYVNDTKRLGARIINEVGVPISDIQVRFEPKEEGVGELKGSVLSSAIATSDQYGVAAVDVIAGPEPTYFTVFIDSDEIENTLTYQVNVIQRNISTTDPANVPPSLRCMNVTGNYEITNNYELGRFLGDGVFNTLQTINRGLTDPGGLIGDWIRDRIGGIIGSALRGVVRQVVNSLLGGLNLPEWANIVINVIQDVTGLLTDLEIKGNLQLGVPDPDNDCSINGIHSWEKLVFHWQGSQCGGLGMNNGCGERELSLAEVGVSASESEFTSRLINSNALFGELEIDEHRLQLNIAVVIIAFLQNVILPERANVNSIGDLIANIMPCDQFGDLAAGLVGNIPFVGGAVRGIARDACRDGVRALGNNLT
jgi:hypothetical protein